jgi:MFS family permease
VVVLVRLALAVLTISVAFLHAEQNLIPPILLVLREQGMIVGGERWELYAGLLGTIPLALGVLSSLVWGYLADIWDRRKLFVLCMLIGSIPGFLTAFARDYSELLLARTLSGVGVYGSYALIFSLVGDIVPLRWRGLGFGLVMTASGLGVLGGMILAGLYARVDWRLPFIIVSLPATVSGLLFLLVSRGVKLGMGEPEVKEMYEKGFEYNYRIKLKEFAYGIKSTPTILFIVLQGIPGTIPWGVIIFWAIAFMNVRWGLTESLATLIVITAGLSMVTGNVVGGVLADRLKDLGLRNSRLWISLTGIMVGLAMTIAFMSYPYPYGVTDISAIAPLALLALLIFNFVSWAGPNVQAIISEVILPEHRGTFYAVFNVTDSVGKALGPSIGAFLINFYKGLGYDTSEAYYSAMVAASMAWLLCAILWLPMFKTYGHDYTKLREVLRRRVSA